MFKCIITEHFGPFCGSGGYGSETIIGMDRSPKRAVAKAERRVRNGYIRKTSNEHSDTGICGGGVPIMRQFKLLKDGKVLVNNWD